MIVVDHLAQGADDRGDLARLDILHVREDQRAVLRELGDIGEVGLGQEVIGDAGSFRLMLRRHEQVGIGGFAGLPAAEILRGSRRGINDADLLDGVVHRDQRRGIGDDVLRVAGEIAGQSQAPLLIRAAKLIEVGAGPPDGVSSACGIATSMLLPSLETPKSSGGPSLSGVSVPADVTENR